MSFVPPDPLKTIRTLREQLEQIQLLAKTYPGDPAYSAAAEHLEASIAKLEEAKDGKP